MASSALSSATWSRSRRFSASSSVLRWRREANAGAVLVGQARSRIRDVPVAEHFDLLAELGLLVEPLAGDAGLARDGLEGNRSALLVELAQVSLARVWAFRTHVRSARKPRTGLERGGKLACSNQLAWEK
jgi:hypothetical protein